MNRFVVSSQRKKSVGCVRVPNTSINLLKETWIMRLSKEDVSKKRYVFTSDMFEHSIALCPSVEAVISSGVDALLYSYFLERVKSNGGVPKVSSLARAVRSTAGC